MTHAASEAPDRHLALIPPADPGTGFPGCLLGWTAEDQTAVIPACDDCRNWAPIGPGRWQCGDCGRISDRTEPDPRPATTLTDLQRYTVERARDALDRAAGLDITCLPAPMLAYQVALIEGHALDLLRVIDKLTADLG